MITIIDYDAGNIKSVEKALLSIGETPVLTRDPGSKSCDFARSWRIR